MYFILCFLRAIATGEWFDGSVVRLGGIFDDLIVPTVDGSVWRQCGRR